MSKGVNQSTIKASRLLTIRKLEKQFNKLQRRFDQITDPQYIAGRKAELLQLEEESILKHKQAKGLNIQQKKLDNQIVRTNNDKLAVVHLSVGEVDKKAQLTVEALSGIELQNTKIQK